MFVLIIGSAIHGGLRFFGPFETAKDAAHYGEHELPKTIVASWEVAQLHRSGDTMDYKAS